MTSLFKNNNNHGLSKVLLRCSLQRQANDQKQHRYKLQLDNVCLNHSSYLISKPRSLICNTGCLLNFSLESRPGTQRWSSASKLLFQIMKNYLLNYRRHRTAVFTVVPLSGPLVNFLRKSVFAVSWAPPFLIFFFFLHQTAVRDI